MVDTGTPDYEAPEDLHPDLIALIGAVVHDHYKIEKLLGRGGMGAVFKGRHTTIDREVAIKVILPETDESASVSERFIQEAKSISRLDHRNCVRLLDFYQDGAGRKYLFMEFLNGTELSKRLGESWSPTKFVHFAKQILEGLDHAHHFGIIHRDIKPDNLYITTNHRGREIVKIIDFGLAKILTSAASQKKITRTGQVFGTPEYMSPEQAAGDRTDQRTDLYALGVLFYEMLSGQRPYQSNNIVELMRMHVMSPVPKLAADVPQPLAAIVDKLLQKKKEDRYQSAKEVIGELDGVVAHLNEFEGAYCLQQAMRRLQAGERERGMYLLERAAKFRNADAMYELGRLYSQSSQGEPDQKLALEWYKGAADLGNMEAMYQLGLHHVEGSGTDQDCALGFDCFLEAAKSGHASAMFQVACCYRFGSGT